MMTSHGEVNLLAVRFDGLCYLDCLYVALASRDLVAEFDRLTSANLSGRGAPIDILVDESSGRLDHEFKEFAWFVWNTVFLRVPIIVDNTVNKM